MNKAKHKKASYILHRIYRLLHERRIVFKFNSKLKKNYAEVRYDFIKGYWLVVVNALEQPKEGIISTMLHECLHVLYTDKEEPEIVELEKFVYNNISDHQRENFFILCAERINRKYNE